jgi:hypothetical protein
VDEPTGGSSAAGNGGVPQPLPRDTEFQLGHEFEGLCERAKNAIEVNLGHSPEAFVRAAQCQISGAEPDAGTVSELSEQLRTVAHVRRVDVVRTLCLRAGRTCVLNYSDPWQQQVDLTAACVRKGTRDLGAVLMYWSECPTGVNCGLDWANTHAPGMSTRSPLLGFDQTSAVTLAKLRESFARDLGEDPFLVVDRLLSGSGNERRGRRAISMEHVSGR